MGNQPATTNTNVSTNAITGQQVNAPNQQQRGFGFFNSTRPKADYAERVNQHLVLKGPAQYSLSNLNNIYGEPIANYFPNGQGDIFHVKQYESTYQGPFTKGAPHGKGVAHFKDGGYYSGDFLNGDAHGQGLYIYPNGSIYKGLFANSLFDGPGQLIYVDKRMRYDGNFSHGLPQGYGKQTYHDGGFYQGNFHKGEKSGMGIYQWGPHQGQSQKYEGLWQNGLMHGRGVLRRGNDILFQGNFSRGMKSGYGVFRTSQGTYQGNFDNDHLNGNGSFIWNDGKIYEGNFLNSMMDGNGRMYYPSNQVAQGMWQRNHNKALITVKNDYGVENKIREIKARHLAGHNPNFMQSQTNINKGISNNSNIYADSGIQSRSSNSNIIGNNSQTPVVPYRQPRAVQYA